MRTERDPLIQRVDRANQGRRNSEIKGNKPAQPSTSSNNPSDIIRDQRIAGDLLRGRGHRGHDLRTDHRIDRIPDSPLRKFLERWREHRLLRPSGSIDSIVNRIYNGFGKQRAEEIVVKGFSDLATINALQRALGQPETQVLPAITGAPLQQYLDTLMQDVIAKSDIKTVMTKLAEIKGKREFVSQFKKAADLTPPVFVPLPDVL